MLSENQIATIAISVLGAVGAGITSALGAVWALFRFFLDVKIERAVEKYDKENIQERCKNHKIESKSDLKDIKEDISRVFALIGTINQNILNLAQKK